MSEGSTFLPSWVFVKMKKVPDMKIIDLIRKFFNRQLLPAMRMHPATNNLHMALICYTLYSEDKFFRKILGTIHWLYLMLWEAQ